MPAWRRNGQRREHGSSVEVFCRKDTAPQRAQQFYQNQVAGRLTPVMKQFIQRMEMAFIATSDGSGECDSSFRAGPAGFIRGLDDRCARHPGVRAVSATRAATAWGAAQLPDCVAVRNSRFPDGPALVFTGAAWDAFLRGVKVATSDDRVTCRVSDMVGNG